jgi:hypothetical protein
LSCRSIARARRSAARRLRFAQRERRLRVPRLDATALGLGRAQLVADACQRLDLARGAPATLEQTLAPSRRDARANG